MQKLRLQLDKYKKYKSIECSDTMIWILERFFNDLSLIHIPLYIKWSLNQKSFQLEGNNTILKKENHFILIGSLFSDEQNDGPFFKISIDQFVKLLSEWDKLVKAKTQKITITEDNRIITIEGE